MEEEFKNIKGFENYSISNFGNVRNDKTGRILKPGISSGYYNVVLCDDGKQLTKRIHKLVADAFIPNPKNKNCIDHIDNNRLNNNINNLRYATSQENNMNKKLSCKNTSGFKGISFNKQRNKWEAYIKIDGKSKNLGYFEKIEDAVNARVKEATKFFGEYKNSCEKEITINLNVPDDKIKVNLNINIVKKKINIF